MRAIRASFAQDAPTYSGTHFEFSGFVVEPSGIQSHIRIWVGGRTRRSLRRALELGDGWIPFGLSFDELRTMLGDPTVVAALEARGSALDVVLAPEPPLDPLGDRGATLATLRRYRDIGATGLSLRLRHETRAHYLEQLEAMMGVAEDAAEGR